MQLTITTSQSTRTYPFRTVSDMRRATQRIIEAVRRANIQASISVCMPHAHDECCADYVWSSGTGWTA